MSAPTDTRFTLRDLPLPAKLVVTCFLMAVGLGYTSAMVQLHFQDSKSGQPMPTMEDVVLKFTGKKWFTSEPDRPRSRFVKLLLAPAGAPFNGTGTMAPAFTTRDGGEFGRAGRGGAEALAKLQAERKGELDVTVLWAESPPDVRKKAYENDHFGIEPGKEPEALTAEFKNTDGAVKIKSILEARCARCHMKDGDDSKAETFPLQNYAQIEKYLVTPEVAPFRAGGDWVKVEEPMSLDKLTQSTHAHLLSFAVLFSLTGLVFAFTSYPTSVRCLISPLVLVAIVTDVAFWWLARMSDGYGVYFAMGVICTGGLAGMGLGAQILLSLWNMYGAKGKVVLLLLFGVGAVAGGLVFLNVIKPGLEEKKARLELAKAEAGKKPEGTKAEVAKPELKQPEKKDDKKQPDPVPAVPAGESDFARVLKFPLKGPDGKDLAVTAMPFDKKGEPRNMVRAFFDKDLGDYADAVKGKDKAEQERLAPERHGEVAAVAAWLKLPDAERKRVYEADAFGLPPELLDKPLTAAYVKDGQVKVKSILVDRCVRCHADEADVQFDDKYASLLPYLEPKPGK